jgi:serine/threonine protein kinase
MSIFLIFFCLYQSAVLYLYELASGLLVLHENKIIHRDLKLANVFITGDKHCKIGDFDLSKKVENSFGTAASVVGTSFLSSFFFFFFFFSFLSFLFPSFLIYH